MIRHGQATFGEADYDRLSPKGKQQARIVANQLCRLNTRFDAVYTGTLVRQRQTCQVMAETYAEKQQPLPAARVIPELDEYDAATIWCHLRGEILADHPKLTDNPDQWRNNPKAFQRIFSRVVNRWVAGEHALDILESWPAFRQRVARGLGHIMQAEGPGKRIAVFSSAGPVAVAVQMATDLPDDRCVGLSWQILNAGITRFLYHKHQFTLTGFNDVAALEMEGGLDLLTYR